MRLHYKLNKQIEQKKVVKKKGPKIRKNTLGTILKLGVRNENNELSSCSYSRKERSIIRGRGRGSYEPSHDSIYVNYEENSKV